MYLNFRTQHMAQPKTKFHTTLIAASMVPALLAGLVISTGVETKAAPIKKAPAYVSAKTCAQCHQEEFNRWEHSHHAWALKHANAQSVLGNFDNTEYDHNGTRTRFLKEGETYFIETDNNDGSRSKHEIKFTVGVEPLQQYLIELEGGKLQALDIAWDTKNKKWFHLYPGQTSKPGDGLHWTGPYKNWNARCAECHQTGFEKNYSPKTKTYQSKWRELNVACEACHGPGAAHVKWAKNPQSFDNKLWEDVDAKGLTHQFEHANPEKEIELCARCHSRRRALGSNSPPPNSKFADHYQLALLRDNLYHADGQIDEEVYVYGSFLQSKMFARGVRCTNCHEPHSGRLNATGNVLCTQCHSPAGNENFPSLIKKNYDSKDHHHHKVASPGAQCVSCHMSEKTYMRVDPRRDHSFRVPRPDLSSKIGTPNACNTCHNDKTAPWATDKLKAWYPSGRTGKPHYGEVLHAGREDASHNTIAKLMDLARDETKPAIARATALDTLRRSGSPEILPPLLGLLDDKDDLIRAAAVRLFDHAPPAVKQHLVTPKLSDSRRSVRVEAGRQFLTVPATHIPEKHRADARHAIGDYQRSIVANADFPETQMQIAGLAMVLKKFAVAERALRSALSLDPQLADAWLSLARIQMATRKPKEAHKTLQQATTKLPGNGPLHLQLGALLTDLQEPKRAIEALEKSKKQLGEAPEILELLALNHFATGDLAQAHTYATRLTKKYPTYQLNPLVRQILKSAIQSN